MKSFAISILFFLLFVLFCLGAAFGVLRPEHSSVSSIGPLQVAAYDNGISIYQNFRGHYYSTSPFNDYLITSSGKRTALIGSQELTDGSFTTSFAKPTFARIYESVGNYLGFVTPSITYFTQGKTIDYKTSLKGNRMTLTTTVSLKKEAKVKEIGSTISFNSGDFIYDSQGKLYTYIPENTLQLFANTYGTTLTPTLEDLNIVVPSKTVFLYNPEVAGVIAIHAGRNQTLQINRDAKLIEITQKPNPENINLQSISVEIEGLSDPKTAKQ